MNLKEGAQIVRLIIFKKVQIDSECLRREQDRFYQYVDFVFTVFMQYNYIL